MEFEKLPLNAPQYIPKGPFLFKMPFPTTDGPLEETGLQQFIDPLFTSEVDKKEEGRFESFDPICYF